MKTHPSIRSLLCAALAFVGLLSPGRALADTANTQAVVEAANAFLATLSTTQKTAIDSSTSSALNTSCQYNFSLTNAEVWSNIPVATSFSGATRNGLMLGNLTTAQQTAALDVATAALGTTGKKLFDDIRAADRYISGEVTNAKGSKSSAWGYGKYFIAFIGTPSTTSAWTLQLCGHHIAYNITYNGTYASCTPMFAGTEPNSWTDSTGTYAPLGTQRTLLTQLRPTLTTSALLSGTFSDVVFGPNGSGPGATSAHDTTQPKVYPTTGRGQLYSALTPAQQALVLSYIQTWVNTRTTSETSDLLAIYTSPQALAETYIGYSGSSTTLAQNANYFRVDGPRLWIEFSVQTGVYDMSSVHDHGIWRDKLADYGAAYGTTTVSTTLRPPVISTQPASATISSGSTTLTVASSTSGTLTYQWYQDGAAISDATKTSYSASSAGSYYVTVLGTGGLTTSSAATVSVSASPPSITTQPASTSVTAGSSASFTVAATGTGTLSYQWYFGTAAIDGATTATLTLDHVTTANAGSYYVVVTDSVSSTTSDTVTLTVTAATEPLQTFLDTYHLTDADADDDHDGISNALEFILGGDPTVSNSTILPVAGYDSTTSLFSYTFFIVDDLGSVTWTCQYSTDLTTWTDAVSGTGNVTITAGAAADGYIPITITIPATGERMFLRLAVGGL